MSLPQKDCPGQEPVVCLGDLALHLGISTNERTLRYQIVVQTRNVPEPHGQIGGGLAVWRVEGTVFRGILIEADVHMESSFDIRDRTL